VLFHSLQPRFYQARRPAGGRWIAVFAGLDSANIGAANAKEVGAEKPKPNVIGADEALRRLTEGNARYPTHRDFSAGRAERTSVQFPIAAILSCADSAWRLNLRSTKDPAMFLLSGSPAISPMTMGSPVSNMR
jgi:hypothetical protein